MLVVLLAGYAGAPVFSLEQHVKVAQHPAPGGMPGELGEYRGSDGASLAYVSYTQTGADTALVYLHGIESHAGWFALAADALRNRGFDVYCLDRRGSGLIRENRGLPSGHADDYTTLLADIRAFITPLHGRYDEVFLVGLSFGGNRHPIQLFLAGGDRIIDNDGVLKLLKRGAGPGLDVLMYEDQTHSIQLDAPQRLVDDMTDWLTRHSESP